jgi:hypothetical protein
MYKLLNILNKSLHEYYFFYFSFNLYKPITITQVFFFKESTKQFLEKLPI